MIPQHDQYQIQRRQIEAHGIIIGSLKQRLAQKATQHVSSPKATGESELVFHNSIPTIPAPIPTSNSNAIEELVLPFVDAIATKPTGAAKPLVPFDVSWSSASSREFELSKDESNCSSFECSVFLTPTSQSQDVQGGSSLEDVLPLWNAHTRDHRARSRGNAAVSSNEGPTDSVAPVWLLPVKKGATIKNLNKDSRRSRFMNVLQLQDAPPPAGRSMHLS